MGDLEGWLARQTFSKILVDHTLRDQSSKSLVRVQDLDPVLVKAG
jgi:hypothetical protein